MHEKQICLQTSPITAMIVFEISGRLSPRKTICGARAPPIRAQNDIIWNYVTRLTQTVNLSMWTTNPSADVSDGRREQFGTEHVDDDPNRCHQETHEQKRESHNLGYDRVLRIRGELEHCQSGWKVVFHSTVGWAASYEPRGCGFQSNSKGEYFLLYLLHNLPRFRNRTAKVKERRVIWAPSYA